MMIPEKTEVLIAPPTEALKGDDFQNFLASNPAFYADLFSKY